MNKQIWTIAKLQMRNIKVAYLVTGICMAAMLVQSVVAYVLYRCGIDYADKSNSTIGIGWYGWLVVLIAAIIMPLGNFTNIINLGGRRLNYLWGTLTGYVVLTGAASMFSTVLCYAADRPLTRWGMIGTYWAAPDIYGWSANGAVVAFLQQWAFLLLVAVFIHTLVAAQSKWYGWVAAGLVVAVISVFTPIKPLRDAEVWFFKMIIFNPSWLLQIVACLVLAGAIYALNKPIFDRRAV
ncbi:MAG: hypothetical protein FWD80_01050 [Propionibacteriaceae bacterium]|nr:hypothetical protein [Propionibacteriaceae bacterium]